MFMLISTMIAKYISTKFILLIGAYMYYNIFYRSYYGAIVEYNGIHTVYLDIYLIIKNHCDFPDKVLI